MEIDSTVLFKNKVLLLLSFLLIFLVAGGGWFLYERVMFSYDAMETIPEKEEELKVLTARLLKLEGLEEDTYKQRNLELVEVLPENIDLSLALGGLVTIARDSKFEVISGKTSNSQNLSQTTTQNMFLKFSGDNKEIRSMMERLSKVKPVMKTISLEASFSDFDKADYSISVETYAWSYPQTTFDSLSVKLPAIENQDKYEKLFADIRSWEKIVPALDFVFEGSDKRDIFKFGSENDFVKKEEPIPTPTPVEPTETPPNEDEI